MINWFKRNRERVKPKDIEKLITELKLPAIIHDLFQENNKSKILGLNDDYHSPSQIFLLTKKEQDSYKIDTIKPILSRSSSYCIYAYVLHKQKNQAHNPPL